MPELPSEMRQRAASVLLFQSIWQHPVGAAWLGLVRTVARSQFQQLNEGQRVAIAADISVAYGAWFATLGREQRSWQDWLLDQIERADNPFSQAAASQAWPEIPEPLQQTARSDLQQLQHLLRGDETIAAWVEAIAGQAPVIWPAIEPKRGGIATCLMNAEDWGTYVESLAAHYRQRGVGLFGDYRAVRWQKGALQGVPRVDPVRLETIYGCDRQKAALCQNTEALVARQPALNVLLYGARGTGKSSLVKAMLNQYGDAGLRLVEVSRADIGDLQVAIERLSECPHAFIVFIDDLSFAEDETEFKQLKAMLEGDVAAQPDNVRIYATSNRRHLVKEHFDDRPNPTNREVHAWDTVQEKLSLSDRFGLTLTFTPLTQADYFAAVEHLARTFNVSEDVETLRREALKWAQQQNGFSGRTARQFIDRLRGSLALSVSVR